MKRTHTTGRDGSVDLHTFVVADERGAATIWWSDTRQILGHRVCGGVGLHSPVERDGWVPPRVIVSPGPSLAGCEFLDGKPCWSDLLSTMGLSQFYELLGDQGMDDPEAVWSYLEGHLDSAFGPVPQL